VLVCDFLPLARACISTLDLDAMNSDIAEVSIPEDATAPAGRPGAVRAARRGALARARRAPRMAWLERLRADPARMTAARESWRALWSSRLLVWSAGVGTIAAFGFGPLRKTFNPPGITGGFGWLGDALAAPAARWDSAWYLVIARYGYRPELGAYTQARQAYFPLYPLGIRAISWFGVPPVLAGVLISTCAFGLALYGIHRLATLELARARRFALSGERLADAARLTVLVMAFTPMAFFFSAVYSEALFMAFSVGLFWNARQGRWAWAGVFGALATGTRSTGTALLLPALLIYLYGPREDRPPDWPGRLRRRALPRYRVRRDALWLALVPVGVALYATYLALSGGDALGSFHAEHAWGRELVGPLAGAWDGLKAAFDGARQLLSFQRAHVYFRSAPGDPFVSAGHDLLAGAFLIAAAPAVVGVLRRLPLAYAVYVLIALALPLSYPVRTEPLMSLPRFMVVLFPFGIWLGAWLAERSRLRRPALVLSATLMAVFVAQFATWHWVA
jgi:hypothetical protein